MGKAIGIDLGTTNSVVAIMDGGDPKVIINEEGSRLTPSVVAFTKENGILVGQVAKRQAVTNPENTIFSIKRFMGRRYEEINEEIKMVPYDVIKGQKGDVRVGVKGKQNSPQELSAMILQKLKKSAEAHIGSEVTDAVITVPAYFNDSQRQATKDAGKIAGLNVLRIINEPTASALAYGLEKKKDHRIAVYDFGGGTFDISILEVGDNVVEVRATNGDTHLGGDNFDLRIINWMVTEFKNAHGVDLSRDKMALQRLKEAAEKAKIELSSTGETDINLPFITADASGPKHMNMKLSRAKFEQLTLDLVERSLAPSRQAMKDAAMDEVDEVILVGGSTRIPKIQEMIKNFFGKDPYKGVNPDELVALGAAVQAGVLAGEVKDILLLDVTPLSLGIETLGGIATKLIERNTTIPTKKSEMFTTAADNQTSVDISVLQGEREMAKHNRTLGRFHLTDIPPASRGVPQIEVTFDIDANGIVNVAAKEKETGKEQNITITASSALSEDEIEKMVKEAEIHNEEDRKKRKETDLKNQADSLVYQTEKTLNENRGQISSSEIEAAEETIKTVKEAIKSGDSDKIKSKVEELTKLSHRLAELMYKQAESAGKKETGQNQPFPGGEDDDVINAEFESTGG